MRLPMRLAGRDEIRGGGRDRRAGGLLFTFALRRWSVVRRII
jgi:hypothetical protein